MWKWLTIMTVALAVMLGVPETTGAFVDSHYYDTTAFFNPTGPFPYKDWRPFSDASAFNTQYADTVWNDSSKVCTVATCGATSLTMVNDLLRYVCGGTTCVGSSSVHSIATDSIDQGFYDPTYYGHNTDPTYTINPQGGTYCSGASDWPNPLSEGNCKIHIPDGAQTTDGSDYGMNVYWAGKVFNFVGCVVNGPPTRTITGQSSYCSVRFGPADGDGSWASGAHPNGESCGVIAAGLCGTTGRLRPQELMAGSLAYANIPHALAITVDYNSSTNVCPADSSGDGSGGSVPEGQLFLFNPNYDTSQLSSDYEIAIVRAAQKYGLYVTDSSGSGGFGLVIEGDKTYTQFGKAARWPTVVSQNGLPADSDLYLGDIPWTNLHAIRKEAVPGC